MDTKMPSIGFLLNECQRSSAMHKKCARMMLEKRKEKGESFLEELVYHLQHVLLVFKQDSGVDRVLNFIVTFVTTREEGLEEDCDEFLESTLSFLVCISHAKDKAVRYRVCQLIAGIFNGMQEDAEVSDDLANDIMTSMLERLQDKVPQVRAQAARALARLQDPGSDSTFEDDPIVEAYRHLLACDKNKDVRKAALASIAVCDMTMSDIIERTSDISEEVRRIAYHVIASKIPLESMKIADRVLVLRRGLGDRVKRVADAARHLLGQWFKMSAQGDVLKLLGMLDVELYEKEAVLVVQALIQMGIVKPIDAAKEAATKGEGLRGVTIHRLLLSEEALFWRVIVEWLNKESELHGSHAATSLGATAAVEAAVASDYLEAIENALPATVTEYITGIEQHAHAGKEFRFTTRQLLELSSSMDMTESTGRSSASNLVSELLFEMPSGEDSTLAADGGDGTWERTAMKMAKHVHSDTTELADFVAGIVKELKQTWLNGGDVRSNGALWTQTLAIVAAFWEISPSTRSASSPLFSVQEMLECLVIPALQHENAAARREAVRCLGLYCIMDGPNSGSYLRVLQIALSSEFELPAVRSAAARALLDLALVRGIHGLEECIPVPEASQPTELTLMSLMMGTLNETPSDERIEGPIVDEDEPRTVVAEGMAKLLMHLDVVPTDVGFSKEEATQVFSRLVLLHFDASTEDALHLRQCLSVFFDAFACSSVRHHDIICSSFLPAVRKAGSCIASKKGRGSSGSAQVARFLMQLLQIPIGSSTPRAEIEDDCYVELKFKIAAELKHCAPGCYEKEGKAYIAALCKALAGTPWRSKDVALTHQMHCLVTQLANMPIIRSDRSASKDLRVFQDALSSSSMQKHDALSDEGMNDLWSKAVDIHQGDEELQGVPLPFTLKEPQTERRTTRSTQSSLKKGEPEQEDSGYSDNASDDSDDAFEDCEEYTAPEVPDKFAQKRDVLRENIAL